ncbi:MAG: TolC family protein [Bryobacterales bacterium]|nr:TolC family protein [Bryobacterales bacterium]
MRVLLLSALVMCVQGQTSPPRVGVGITQRKVSLDEAVQTALKNNLEIEIEKTAQTSAYEAIRGAKGFLDPNFRWLPSAETRNTPTSSSLASSTGKITENAWAQNFYFRQRTPWQGMSFHVDFENSRLSTNNPFVGLTPYITPRFTAGLALPLLRDRLIDQDRAQLTLRRKQADISDASFALRVIDVIARVEQAYYDLVAARADLVVESESVDLAREQLDRTKRMIASGTVAPVELAAAEAELERRKDTYFTALTQLTASENALKLLLAAGRDQDLWKDEVIPTSDQKAAVPAGATSDLNELVNDSLRRRVELKVLELNRGLNDVQKQSALNQRKVQLNLTAAYLSTGLAGTILQTENPFAASQAVLVQRLNDLSVAAGLTPINVNLTGGGVPADFVGGYGQSLSNLFSGRFSTFSGGLSLDWTPRNNAAESALAQTAITERKIGLERRQMEQAIAAQVRNALQAVLTSQQRIAAAEASARAAKEKLDSETRLFQTGESTNFFVLTRQNEFADSRRRLVLATAEYNKSVARLEVALGRTLEEYKITLK